MNSACTVRLRTVFHRPPLKFAQSAKFSRRVLCEDGELSVFVSALLRPSSVLTPSSPSFYRSVTDPKPAYSVLLPASPSLLRSLTDLTVYTPTSLRLLPFSAVSTPSSAEFVSSLRNNAMVIFSLLITSYIFMLIVT